MPKKTVDIEVAEEVIVADEPMELVDDKPVVEEVTDAGLPKIGIKPDFKPKNEVVVHWNKLHPREQYAVKTLMQYWSDDKRTIK